MAEKHPGKRRTEKELVPVHPHTVVCSTQAIVLEKHLVPGQRRKWRKTYQERRKCSITEGESGLTVEKVLVEEDGASGSRGG